MLRKLFAPALFCSLLLAAPSALAHAHPKTMTPAADSTVAAPATISVTFSEALEPQFSSLTLTDMQGKKLNAAGSKIVPGDAKTLTLAAPHLDPGAYEVHWVSVAEDGHRMEGKYGFHVK